MRALSVAALALVLVLAAGVARAEEAHAQVDAEAEAEVDVEAELDAETEAALDAAEKPKGPTGRRPGPEPELDIHPSHREPLPVDKDIYSLKLCCTQYHGLDKNGIPYATCNQKYYWVCGSKTRCEYKPPRRVPKVPFSKTEKCPNFSPRTHSNFAGPCLRECSRILFSPELRNDRDLDDIDFGDS